jgi:hypothetical protein
MVRAPPTAVFRLKPVNNSSIALLACVAWALACPAAKSAEPSAEPSVDRPVILADWQGPLSLPPQFRNHCSYDRFSHRYLCSNHCGFDYQFYYCQPESFGCCHIGRGYCGWDGLLRCSP